MFMYKTTNIPTPSVMTNKGLQYPNVPGSKDSINSLKDFLSVGRSIALYTEGPKYDPMENVLKGRAIQNVVMGDEKRATLELNEIFKSLYAIKNDVRNCQTQEELEQLEHESWPSVAIDIASWWAKYVDEPTGRAKIAQIERDYDPQNLSMSESLLRRYIKSVINS